MRNKRWAGWGMAVWGALVFGVVALAQEKAQVGGFAPQRSDVQVRWEQRLKGLPEAASIERYHRILTEEPHVAGTAGGRKVAEFVLSEFKKAGLDAQLSTYDVLLSYPRTVEVELVVPEKIRLANREESYADDKDSFDPRVDPPWHAYSANADLTAQVVYVNHGRAEDYDTLEKMGVQFQGKIGLARYFRGYRGGKSLEAERRGLAGLIIYSDPAEDGYVQGEVYPNGPWGPSTHVQRGANVYDFKVPGDPLTPGWASVEGARRIPESESEILPKIPTVPLSHADALHILRNLGGPVVPGGWQGGLPLTYHTGPGGAEVRLKLDISREVRPIHDVIARIPGSVEPEKSIILSNHHDAWVYGGVDPSSGTAVMLELGRVLGQLVKEGWKPRRTIILGCWDAEEYTLTGSTEWGEENAEDLRRNGVACLNVDSAASGRQFSASAVPSLRTLLSEVTQAVLDPVTGRTVFEEWSKATGSANIRGYGVSAGSRRDVDIGILGSGSDYTVFFNFLGIPSIDMLFDGPYGVYHSQYDNHRWMSLYGDPGFIYHRSMTSVWGILAARLADSDVLPFDYRDYADDLKSYLAELRSLAGDRLSFEAVDREVNRFEAAADKAFEAISRHLESTVPSATAETINRALMDVERDFTTEQGIPGRPWFKHLIYAPLPSYEAETLPGVREALKEADQVRAAAQLDVLTRAVAKAASSLEKVR